MGEKLGGLGTRCWEEAEQGLMFLALLGKVSPSLWSPGSIPAQGWRGQGGVCLELFPRTSFQESRLAGLGRGKGQNLRNWKPWTHYLKAGMGLTRGRGRRGGGTLMGGVLRRAGSVAHPVY